MRIGNSILGGERRSLIALTCALAPLLSPCDQAMAADTLAKIRATGQVVIGHRENEIPFSYVANGKVMGYAIDICLRVVDDIRKELERNDIQVAYRSAPTATRFILVTNGSIDLECSTTTDNAERRKIVQFSYPYFFTANRFVSKKANKLHLIGDLAGRTVTSTTGTINIEQLNAVNNARKLNVSVLLQRSHQEAFNLVSTDRASAFIMDDVLLAGLVANSGHPQDFEISTEAFSQPEPYGIMMPPDDPALKALVNRTLARLYASREIEAIYAKWFAQPVPPFGLNLKLPVSPELKATFDSPKEYLD